MKRTGAGVAVLVLGLLVPPVQGQQDRAQDNLPIPPEGNSWKLVWHDEFDGTTLDQSKWVPDRDGKRRDGTEIDIMEKPWLDDRVQHTFHWDGYGKAHKSEGKVVKVPGMMEGFHTFAIWWKPNCPISS